jgi:nucleolin
MGKKDKKKLPTPSESESEAEEVAEEVNPEDTSDLSDEEEEEVKQVQPAKKGGKPEEVQVFVSGIPYECSEQEFKEFFGELAKGIKEIKMPRYQDSGRCIGYAHITMSTPEGTQKVLEMSG